jgi:hypothetical protein
MRYFFEIDLPNGDSTFLKSAKPINDLLDEYELLSACQRKFPNFEPQVIEHYLKSVVRRLHASVYTDSMVPGTLTVAALAAPDCQLGNLEVGPSSTFASHVSHMKPLSSQTQKEESTQLDTQIDDEEEQVIEVLDDSPLDAQSSKRRLDVTCDPMSSNDSWSHI